MQHFDPFRILQYDSQSDGQMKKIPAICELFPELIAMVTLLETYCWMEREEEPLLLK